MKLHHYKLAETRHTQQPSGRIVLDHYPDVMGEVPLAGADTHLPLAKGGALPGRPVASGGAGDGTAPTGDGLGKQAGGRTTRKSESDSAQDWQHMLSAIESHTPSPSSPTGGGGGDLTVAGTAVLPAPPPVAATGATVPMATIAAALPPPVHHHHHHATPTTSSLVEYSLPERTTGHQERLSDCRLEMEALVAKLRTRYAT